MTEEGLDREIDFYGRQAALHELLLNAITHGSLGAEMQAAERLQPFFSTLERLAGRWGSAGPLLPGFPLLAQGRPVWGESHEIS